jgi:putative secretion ATPase (PEP-CTERM system associated)
MYVKHFKLKFKPFELVPNPDLLFLSNTHRKALTYLNYGIQEKIGFILLTGEVGSGKTTIIRNLIKNLNGSVVLSRVHNTKVTSEELISMINEDFGLSIEGKNKITMLSELNEFLVAMYAQHKQPILLIDEAQNLTAELLEEIRLLSNLETDKSKLLQIILVGQPELKKTLALPELMQLRQRININYHLTPLSMDETAMYISHRLKIAGNPDAFMISGNLVKHVFEFSMGIPRLINIICDFALLAAFADGKSQVTEDIIADVRRDLEKNEYWLENEDVMRNEGDSERSGDDDGMSGMLVKRLLRLEEKLDDYMAETSRHDMRIRKIEESSTRLMDQIDGDLFRDILYRMEDKLACRILTKIAEDNKLPDLVERIEKLEMKIDDLIRDGYVKRKVRDSDEAQT